MHGRIKVTSTPGSGSTFTVTLPAAGRVGPDARPLLTGDHLMARRSVGAIAEADPLVVLYFVVLYIVVLYIEDNAVNIHLVERILRFRPQVELATATDGDQGPADAG